MLTGHEKADELIKCVVEKSEFINAGLHFYPQIKCLMPKKYHDFEKRIHDLTFYEDDVWVLTYPKCGTTWTQEMVWLIGHDVDYQGAEVGLTSRFPFMEFLLIITKTMNIGADNRYYNDSRPNDSNNDVCQNDLASYLCKHLYYYEASRFYQPVPKCSLPSKFRDLAQRIRDLEVYQDDTWALIFPRCGSTRVVEMVWLIGNDMDFHGAEKDVFLRFPLLELRAFSRDVQDSIGDSSNSDLGDVIDYVERMQRPRFIRSHLPLDLLPKQLMQKKPKIVSSARDPKDAAVSYFHLMTVLEGYDGTPEKFFEAYREGLTPFGCYWHHLGPIWKLRDEPNVLSLTYEETNKDILGVIKRTVKFFGKNFSQHQISELAEHLSFSKMKTNDAVNFKAATEFLMKAHNRPVPRTDFIRKGIVGDYKNLMSEVTIEEFEKWNAEMKKKFKLSGDKNFPY